MTWAPDYVEVDELKAWRRISDTVDDAELSLAITAASRAIDRATGRQFGQVDTPDARTYTARRLPGGWTIDVDDLGDVTGLELVDDAAVTLTGYTLGPRNALATGRVYTRAVLAAAAGSVTVTGLWGWAAVPDTVKLATLLQASRFMARRDSPFGVAGSPDQGTELRLLARVDPDVELMLRPYRRAAVVA